MDHDLWGPSGPSDSQVLQDGNCYMELGWMCDFHFGYGFDAMEENALDEKYCVQVLRILNTKADTEIDELETDLAYLQSELALAEYDDWSEVCCSALRKKIECLDISIRSLRNQNDVEIHLIMHREPAERIHEILKALLDKFCYEKDEQESSCQSIASDLPSASPQQEPEILNDNERLSDFGDTEIIINEEMKGSCNASLDDSNTINSSLQLQEKNTNDFGTVQLADVSGKDHFLHYLEPAVGHSDKKKVLEPVELEITRDEEVKEHDLTTNHEEMLLSLPLKSTDEKKDNLKMTKTQLADANGKDTCVNSLESAAGHSVKKIVLENENLGSTGNGEIKEHDSTANHKKMLGVSPLMSTEEGKCDLEMVKTQLAGTAKFSSIDALKCSIGVCHNQNIYASESIIIKEEVSSSLPMVDFAISTYPSTAHDVNLKSTQTTVKDFHASMNLNEIKKLCKTDLRPNVHGKMGGRNTAAAEKNEALFIQETNGNSGVEQKLCDFAANAVRKQRLKESKVASIDRTNSSNSILKVEGKKKNTNCHTSHLIKVGQAGLILTEHSALTSLSDMQDEREKLASVIHPKGNKKVQKILMVENAVNDDELILNFTLNQSRKKAKRILQSDSASIQSPSFLSTGDVSSSSSNFKTKKQLKFGSNANSRNSSKMKTTKRVVQQQSAGVDDNRSSSKKRKISTSIPVLLQITGSSAQIEFSEGHGNPVMGGSKNDLLIKESNSCTDPGREVTTLTHSATTNLNDLKISELRAIAKEHKLTNYYKLKKTDLIQQLVKSLGCW